MHASLSARGRRRAHEAVFCAVTGGLVRPIEAGRHSPPPTAHGRRPSPLARAGQHYMLRETCWRRAWGRGDRGGCGRAAQSRWARGARLIRSVRGGGIRGRRWLGSWDPREALVGWHEVGSIRWVRSSVHVRVCGDVYVKNMHERIITRQKHGMRHGRVRFFTTSVSPGSITHTMASSSRNDNQQNKRNFETTDYFT